jgi:hypothetical protein
VVTSIERPLKLGEVLAETVRLYGERIWTSVGLGLFVALTLLLGAATGHFAGFVAVFSLAFTAAWAVAARLVAGDRFGEAWAQVALRAPVLLVLTFIVSVPFALSRIDPLLLLLAVFWLGLTGFAIPVAMLEREDGGWHRQLGFVLQRSVTLARAEYLHAVGIAAALVIVYILFGQILLQALLGFADNGRLASTVLVEIVLAPFFFIGLSVLYFEQSARALSAGRRK